MIEYKKKYIELKISVEQLENILIKSIKLNTPHRELIAKTILHSLSHTEMGMTHLYNAFVGIEYHYHVKIGDRVLVKFENLPTWRMNKDHTQEAGLLIKGEYMMGVVSDINQERIEGVQISFHYVNDQKEMQEGTFYLNPELITLDTEEYPENLNAGF